jgi:hypothetical protein
MKLVSCLLLVAFGAGCNDEEPAPVPTSASLPNSPPTSRDNLDTAGPTAPSSTSPERSRYCAAADRTIRYATDPERLLEARDAIDRSSLDRSTAERLEQVLRNSRSEFENSIPPEGGWSWENESLVLAINDICRTELEVTSFVAQAEN